MMTRLKLLILVALLSAGCQRVDVPTQPASPELACPRASGPIQIDGKLDEEAWRHAKQVALDIPRDQQQQGLTLEEKGTARLLWDDRFLYVGFEFVDSDVVALGKEDDEGQHLMGDVAEIFLKPTDQTWYWELHVTPAGYVTQYWCVGRGRWGLKDEGRHVKPRFVQAAAQVQGTLNNDTDRDQGWTAEVAIPWKDLDRFNERPDPRANWTILLARYNYTRYRVQATGPELTSWPVLPRAFFHLVEDYAPLKLVP